LLIGNAPGLREVFFDLPARTETNQPGQLPGLSYGAGNNNDVAQGVMMNVQFSDARHGICWFWVAKNQK
jgi:hypothetical protein